MIREISYDVLTKGNAKTYRAFIAGAFVIFFEDNESTAANERRT